MSSRIGDDPAAAAAQNEEANAIMLKLALWVAICDSCGAVETTTTANRNSGMLAAHELREAGWFIDEEDALICPSCLLC